jgi:RNA polymerase sigma factor (sigma-70 family)
VETARVTPEPTVAAAVPDDPHRADLAAWLNEYGPALRAFFTRKVGPDEAQDLVQEVFLCLHSRSVAEQIDNVERYLFKVAHNVLASRHRHRVVQGAQYQVQLEAADEPADELSPERILLGRREYERVIVAVRKLPPRAQTAFLLHRFRQMTYPAIAQHMGISRSAVKQLVLRAMTQLMDELERSA